MIRKKGGCIINMSSQAGFAALPTQSIYCMTKEGISHLTKCLAVEWGKHNIRVNVVAPTFIHTPGTASALSDPEVRADVIERTAALHRIDEPVEVAMVFRASLITGHTLLIDGLVHSPNCGPAYPFSRRVREGENPSSRAAFSGHIEIGGEFRVQGPSAPLPTQGRNTANRCSQRFTQPPWDGVRDRWRRQTPPSAK
jgi:Enoyl-(Acyl carrier protein) reductase